MFCNFFFYSLKHVALSESDIFKFRFGPERGIPTRSFVYTYIKLNENNKQAENLKFQLNQGLLTLSVVKQTENDICGFYNVINNNASNIVCCKSVHLTWLSRGNFGYNRW